MLSVSQTSSVVRIQSKFPRSHHSPTETMKVFALIALCLFALLSLAQAGGHGHVHAVAGDFGYKVEVKHPSHIAGDHKGHHTFVEDKGVQEQYIKVGIYPHVEAHGYEEAHGYGHH